MQLWRHIRLLVHACRSSAARAMALGGKSLIGRNMPPMSSTTVLTYLCVTTKACSRCLQGLLDCS